MPYLGADANTVGKWRRRFAECGFDGLYLDPPERALALCVDEKSQIHALDCSRPLLPMRPGQMENSTHDQLCYGTTTLFAALDIANGRVIG